MRDLHAVAEGLEQARRRVGRGDAVGVHGHAAARAVGHQTDAERAGIGAELLDVGPQRVGHAVRVARLHAVHGVEHSGGVAHGP